MAFVLHYLSPQTGGVYGSRSHVTNTTFVTDRNADPFELRNATTWYERVIVGVFVFIALI